MGSNPIGGATKKIARRQDEGGLFRFMHTFRKEINMHLQSADFSLHFSMQVFENNPMPDTLLTVHVTSGNFSGQSVMDIAFDQFCTFVHALSALYQLLSGTAEIREPYSPNQHITFTGDGRGHIRVQGCLQYANQSLRFDNTLDQTAFPPFIKSLKESCASLNRRTP